MNLLMKIRVYDDETYDKILSYEAFQAPRIGDTILQGDLDVQVEGRQWVFGKKSGKLKYIAVWVK